MAIANDESESIITETLEKFCYILFIDPDAEYETVCEIFAAGVMDEVTDAEGRN